MKPSESQKMKDEEIRDRSPCAKINHARPAQLPENEIFLFAPERS
jgi:hypothetical protein